MSAVPRVVLASASPRRLELLRAVGIDPALRPAQLDEEIAPGEAPAAAALRLARAKARAAAAGWEGDGLVVGADTVVALDGSALGKPRDPADARRMLQALAGRAHEVHTGVALVLLPGAGEAAGVDTSRVVLEPLTDAELDWYVATGEGGDKAGGYAVQGRAALFVRAVHGSHANVVGLPLALLYRLARGLGVDLKRAAGGAA